MQPEHLGRAGEVLSLSLWFGWYGVLSLSDCSFIVVLYCSALHSGGEISWLEVLSSESTFVVVS